MFAFIHSLCVMSYLMKLECLKVLQSSQTLVIFVLLYVLVVLLLFSPLFIISPLSFVFSLFIYLSFTTWICQIIFILLALVFFTLICLLDLSTWICLGSTHLLYDVWVYGGSNRLRIPTAAKSRMEGFLSHGGKGKDGWLSDWVSECLYNF